MTPWRARVAERLGLIRSLMVYWRPGRQRGLRRLYADLIEPGDLVFDVGAHLGDRSRAFAALGAHVIAFEPQPSVARWLRRIVGRHHRITVRPEAVGARPGTARLSISRRTPTVSTLSEDWKRRVRAANDGFRAVRWEDAHEVSVVTLDQMIETYGVPRFCKIDVEGHEARVLDGLGHPIEALSFEFVAGNLDVALACVARLDRLARYEFNAMRGESRSFAFDTWVGPARIRSWLEDGANGARSGDVYARQVESASKRRPALSVDSAEGLGSSRSQPGSADG